jgi:hypothetical protein
MDTLEVCPIKYGWRLTVHTVVLDALTPYFDRGVIRTTLIAKNCEAIYFKDTVNLTSDRVRQRILRRLADKGVTVIQDAHLIALEEACRHRPAPPEGAENTNTRGAPTSLERSPNSLRYNAESLLGCCCGTTTFCR